MSKKKCNKCYKIKERDEYYKNIKNKDGIEYICKECSRCYTIRKPQGWAYKGLNDPEYLKAREELFARAGNGWWWGWTAENSPINELKPFLRSRAKVEKQLNQLDIKLEKTRSDIEKEMKAKRWLESGNQQGEIGECPICKGPVIKKTLRTKYCSKGCGDRAYKEKLRLNNMKKLKGV